MNRDRNLMICPAELSGTLDNSFRKLFQNPEKILKPYIGKGMTVLDLGCGPGFFSVEIAKIVTSSGKVIAADLQEKMLEKVTKKIKGTDAESIIKIHKCLDDRIGISEKVDFVLAFWMIHEVPDQEKLFAELKSVLNPGGKIFIAEPKFHVSKDAFEKMLTIIRNTGFEVSEYPKVNISRAVLLNIKY